VNEILVTVSWLGTSYDTLSVCEHMQAGQAMRVCHYLQVYVLKNARHEQMLLNQSVVAGTFGLAMRIDMHPHATDLGPGELRERQGLCVNAASIEINSLRDYGPSASCARPDSLDHGDGSTCRTQDNLVTDIAVFHSRHILT